VRTVVPREQVAVHLSEELGDLDVRTSGDALSVEGRRPICCGVDGHRVASHFRCACFDGPSRPDQFLGRARAPSGMRSGEPHLSGARRSGGEIPSD
jgi:hypothetical protein